MTETKTEALREQVAQAIGDAIAANVDKIGSDVLAAADAVLPLLTAERERADGYLATAESERADVMKYKARWHEARERADRLAREVEARCADIQTEADVAEDSETAGLLRWAASRVRAALSAAETDQEPQR